MELVILGLDGLSFNMFDRFGVETEFIDGTCQSGVSGDLMSVDTPTTLPAWTSFATGKDPGTHGLTTMVRQSSDYEIAPGETNETEPAIYDILDDAVFVNLPASIGREPAAEGSHLVSAMLAEDKYDAVPDHLQELDAFENYILDHDKSLKSRPDRYFDHVCEITERRRDFAREAFETYDPSVGFVLFSTPDWAGHLLSNFSDDSERATYYSQLLEVVDECAADVAGLADNVVLMSDHGFEKKTHNVHLNDWLHDEGYLVEHETAVSASDIAVSIGKSVGKRSDTLYELMRRAYNYILGTEVGQSIRRAAEPEVDYAESEAWQLRYGCVYLNDDRFDSPTVSDPEALRNRIVSDLDDLEGPDGNPAFRDVLTATEAYADPGEMAPDVLARPAPGRYPTTLESPKGGYVSSTNNFNHRYRGLFAAEGPAFGEARTIEGMSIVDVLPTVLQALERPLLPDFDGEVRSDVLARTTPEVTFLEDDSIPAPRLREESGEAASQREEVVEERLQDLGYME